MKINDKTDQLIARIKNFLTTTFYSRYPTNIAQNMCNWIAYLTMRKMCNLSMYSANIKTHMYWTPHWNDNLIDEIKNKHFPLDLFFFSMESLPVETNLAHSIRENSIFSKLLNQN